MYKKKIIIRCSQIAGTDLSDFPVLIDLKDRDLRIKTDQSSKNIYFADSGGKKKLDHEVAAFNTVQGELKAWVRIPKLSSGLDSVIYLVCGLEGPDQLLHDKTEGSVWDAYHKLVLHPNPDAENQPDSTKNGNPGRVIEKKERKIFLEIPHSESLNITGAITVEAWLDIEQPKKDTFQIVASKWSHLSGLNTFEAYNAENTSGLNTRGFFGAVFDGRYIYFVPQNDGQLRHGRVMRYDSHGSFNKAESWQAHNAGQTSGLKTIGFNAGAFDGRYLYFAPWREELKAGPDEGFRAHGRVLRYDTTGSGASFSLRAADYGHNGGLCAGLPGPSFLINTPEGVLNVRANKVLSKGRHHLAGVYNGSKLSLYLDGELVAEQEGSGKIQENDTDIAVGKFQDGLGCLSGTVSELRISDCARSAAWIKAEFLNQQNQEDFIMVID